LVFKPVFEASFALPDAVLGMLCWEQAGFEFSRLHEWGVGGNVHVFLFCQSHFVTSIVKVGEVKKPRSDEVPVKPEVKWLYTVGLRLH
jgi:hypothetical protein